MAVEPSTTKGKHGRSEGNLDRRAARSHLGAMARAHGIAVLALIGIGAASWLLLANGNVDAPPLPAATGEAKPQAGDAEQAAMQRTATEAATEPMPVAAAAVTEPTVSDPQPAGVVPPNLQLDVRDQRTGQHVASFQWRWTAAVGAAKGEEQGGRTALALAPGVEGELLVESAGLEPVTRRLATPQPGANPLLVDLVLAPVVATAQTGIVVRDADQAPVANIRVTLLREDRTTQVWSRRAAAADGVYRLPAIEPGTYWLRTTAVDAEGMSLPLVPVERQVHVSGITSVEEDIRMARGCLLQLDVLDATGNPFDPKQSGRVELQFLDSSGTLHRVDWLGGTGAEAVVASDQVPARGTIRSAVAVPMGSCTIVVRGPGTAESRFTLALGQGVHREVLRTTHQPN